MAKYKLTRVYIVSAETKAEAREAVNRQPEEYLEFESCILSEVSTGRNGQNGWVKSLRHQLTGN